ncbi:MAG: hypothetical protein ABI134_35725, partial [Byssovorax sp.]
SYGAQNGAGAPQGGYDPSQSSYGAQNGAGAPQGRYDPSQGGYDPSQGGYDPSQGGDYGAPQGGMYEGSPVPMQVGGFAGGCINGYYAPTLGLSYGLGYYYLYSSLYLSPFYWRYFC